MSDQPRNKDLFPSALAQNPAPVEKDSQDRKDKIRSQVDRIMETFIQILPSNYVSQVTGPFYTLQFQALAERLAEFQVAAQEVFSDIHLDFTRPEFLFQIVGLLVFPDAQTDGYPTIPGDVSYRTFLQKMVVLLLQGSKLGTLKQGLELLTDADVEIIEKGIVSRQLGSISGWGVDDQFALEINISKVVSSISDTLIRYGFPEDPFILQENVRLVLRALKPAHVLYDYRHLFRETLGDLFTATVSFELDTFHYDDLRKFCLGVKNITGTEGETLADRALFSDPTRDFSSIIEGAPLEILAGPNKGIYRVVEVLALPFGADPVVRLYQTSPTNLTGDLVVEGANVISDINQNFSQVVEGELLTILAGPNKGTYRMSALLGNQGGPIGQTQGGSYSHVRLSPTLLRVHVRMPQTAQGQSYRVGVDRLGEQEVRFVTDEDVTNYFTL